MPKKTPGLYKRGGIWQIDKVVRGKRLCVSTETSNREHAEVILNALVNEAKQEAAGVNKPILFSEAAARHISTTQVKESTKKRAIQALDKWVPRLKGLTVQEVHDATLAPWIEMDRESGIKSGTVSRDLAVVRTVLNNCARRWRYPDGTPWMGVAPIITMPDWNDKKEKYIISFSEQRDLLKELPPHLARAALFSINTGLRDEEQRAMKWAWVKKVPGLGTFVVIPQEYVKTSCVRVVPLYHTALSVLDHCRGEHSEYVFTYKGEPFSHQFGKRSWRNARKRAGIPDNFDWHAMRSVFATRMRAAGVTKETRDRILGHSIQDMSDIYAKESLEEVMNAVLMTEEKRDNITVLRAVI